MLGTTYEIDFAYIILCTTIFMPKKNLPTLHCLVFLMRAHGDCVLL